MKRAIAAVVMVFAVLAFVSVSADAKQHSSQVQGKKLVREIWADMKANRLEKLEKMMAPGFQAIHSDGVRDFASQLTLIKGLNMGNYKLSDIKVTESGPVLIVTYKISVSETISGKRLSKEPAGRMSIFVKDGDTWLWAAHANMKPIR